MNVLYFDIETAPSAKDVSEFEALVKAPGQFKKPESIEKWIEDNKQAEAEKLHRQTSLSPEDGSIACICWAWDNEEVKSTLKSTEDSWLHEAMMLQTFFDEVAECELPIFVGHNIKGFDLPFLYKRAVINGIEPPARFIEAYRKRYSPMVFDTMLEWAGWGKFIKQDRLGEVLGFQANTDIMTGAEVYDYVLNDDLSTIVKYCQEDVELVRGIYKKMNFIN